MLLHVQTAKPTKRHAMYLKFTLQEKDAVILKCLAFESIGDK